MPPRRPPSVQLTPSTGATPPGPGHNAGPPLDNSGEAWIWRRAVRRAWKTPPREIALARLRRAEQLGLSYREYAAAILDRGHHLGTVALAPGALPAPAIARPRLAGLANCRLIACTAAATSAPLADALARMLDPSVAWRIVAASPGSLEDALAAALAAERAPPAETLLVGARPEHLRIAERLGLAVFKWAADFFAAPARI